MTKPWRMFLSGALPPEGAQAGLGAVPATRSNCPHGFVTTTLLATDSPLTAWAAATAGKLPSPSEGTRRGTLAPPRRQSRFVLDLSAWCIQAGAWNGVGLSPVRVVGHCEQVTPPHTPRVNGQNRDVLRRDCPGGRAAQCFSTTRSLAHHVRPNRDPSRSILAWPLRQRPLPSAAGCVPFLEESSSKDFWTGTAPPR